MSTTAVGEEAAPRPPSAPFIKSPPKFPAFTFPPPSARPGHVILNRFVLYETKTRFFIVGTNAPAGTRFRVLKIDRTSAPEELSITEDETIYSKSQVDNLLEMISNGNKATGGMREIAKFYGIVGFVRFTEGYYLTLITKRSPVALIGGHYIFHIDATMTVSVHSSTTPTSKLDKNSDEARYLQMFQMVDLTKNFYFSYSYDITRTLQWNMTRNPKGSNGGGRNKMFVWNQYLLESAFGEQTGIENQWALPIMYGFVDQSKLSILGRNVFVTLIARRSRFFAGARFLKRGANDRGYVANDVETEQIVSEMSTTSFYGAGPLNANPNHTSFVQHRGSIPLYWTQDNTNMSPKPPIELNVIDPYFSAAALHFNDMFKRYGSPCIVLNLIKAKEKTPRESLLLKEFTECIEYLNQFLPEEKKIWHIRWDMSRASKSQNENVISVLEIIAERTFARTGFFHSGYNQNDRENHRDVDGQESTWSGFQNGVVRTNCIDCLDRTNAAQFVIAKCALGHQLHSLGLIAEPIVPFDCDVVNMLTEMYHDHGDTIALQYGGSHLVNTMETYRKINQWTSHSRDMLESIRRFYSNSFVDAEKQDAMNLFLGNYRTRKGAPALWELPGDYHLHNTTDPELKKVRKSYTRWFSPDALLPQEELAKRNFLEAQRQLQEDQERDQDMDARHQFQLYDAGYDDYVGDGDHHDGTGSSYGSDPDHHDDHGEDPKRYDPEESREWAAENEKSKDGGLHREDSHDRLDKYDPNLKHLNGVKSKEEEHHIERLQSDDEDESMGHWRTALGATGRVNSIDSIGSIQSDQSLNSTQSFVTTSGAETDQEIRRPSLGSSKHSSSVSSITSLQQENRGMPSSQSHPNLPTSNPTDRTDNKSERSSLQESEMLDFKERIVAPLNLRKGGLGGGGRVSSTGGELPVSSSSSISSLQQRHKQQPHHAHHHHRLKHSESRSSIASSTTGGNDSRSYSRGEKLIYDGFSACDDDDLCEDPESCSVGHTSAFSAWEEYWQEYYRPKVQTSFQRLFAYNMNSTSRYIPPNVENPSKKSPFEVRQNNSILSQAEINAKAAANAEKSSMLNWLGLTGGNKNNKSRPPTSKASQSKTLPLSAGRKKAFPSSLDDDANTERSARRIGTGSRFSIAVFPMSSSQSDIDEKVNFSGNNSTRTGDQQFKEKHNWQEEKVRLPSHVPRSKEEEWELTKNVWTNLPQYAVHDPNFVPSKVSKDDTKASSSGSVKSGGSSTDGGTGDPVNGGAPETGGGLVKGRSHIEEMVRRSLLPDVTVQEFKEYKRYAQQFKSIKFDSVPARTAGSFGINPQTVLLWENGTGPTLNGNDSAQGPQPLNDKLPPPAHSSVAGGDNPGVMSAPQRQFSNTSIGSSELNEDGEFYYASAATRTHAPTGSGSEAGTAGRNGQIQISTSTVAQSNRRLSSAPASATTPSSASNTIFSPISPESPFSEVGYQAKMNGSFTAPSATSTTATPTTAIPTNPWKPQDDLQYPSYMPEPPILLAPLQTNIKAPSDSEMVLYNAHVELPKLTLYTVGQASLNPYWGASSGTRARYDAYMMWILKGRYGNQTIHPSAANGSGLQPKASQQQQPQQAPPLRKGSSTVYQSFGDIQNASSGSKTGGSEVGSSSVNGGRQKHQEHPAS
ncbi:phosphatidylinositol-3,5-bisphosphate 5-phosphatase [Mortierella polycephala]|uniref:Phosphatidylinositol-3,5-bisphosphate 5-phosphatase n=1 Tax=Mortierella polycephala TaxID=41804 RepID=A0A9P6QA47_9FUNG|nr:phosphatidylinositol-3,5-bisphosphate 5-phosphatase [Mortierella polycephala]